MDERIRSRLDALQFRPRGSVNEKRLRALQRQIGDLPTDYLEFLRTTGGGRFDESVRCRCRDAPPVAAAGLTTLEEFFGLTGENSIGVARRRSLEVGMSPSLVPIAAAPGGDYYCVGSAGDVVYWDHDSGMSYRAADSLLDLVGRLEVDTERPDTSDVVVELDPDLLDGP